MIIYYYILLMMIYGKSVLEHKLEEYSRKRIRARISLIGNHRVTRWGND